MKRAILATAALLVLACRGPVAADEPKSPSPEDLLKLTRPGAEHERLAGYAGEFDVAVKMGAGSGAAAYTGTAKNRMTVGGRFLQIEYQAKGPADNTEGIFIVGFDSRHQRYALVALDSFGTYFVTSQGKVDEKSGKPKLLGTDDDPQMKALGHSKEFAHVLDLRSADAFAVEVWFIDTRTPARREFKYMTYEFQRKK
jgi:hypothetical protein